MKPTDIKCPGPASLGDRLKSLALYPLPQHAISRVVHAAVRWRTPWWKNGLIRWFAEHYRIDLSEAAESNPRAYPHFNAFFTRALKPGARPLPDDPAVVVSPADGTVSALGKIDGNTIIQAKGHGFTVQELLGGDAVLAERFRNGQYATVYLSPSDYHRVHMPATGTLRGMVHVPGRLFSVAAFTVRAVKKLFARNERVVSVFDTEHGPMVVVLVGAINVASIETVWAGVVTPPKGKRVRRWQYAGDQAIRLERGAEMGRFNLGSTAIVLFGPGQVSWLDEINPGQKIRMGEPMGRLSALPDQNSNVVQLEAYLKTSPRGKR